MWVVYIFLGVLAGVASGFLGIGGASVLVPIFVYLFHMSQHQAQGTTLALMLPPIGILAAYQYYIHGNIKISIAVFVCIGFVFGAFFGADFAHKIPDIVLRKVFGIFLMIIALKMVLGK